MDVKKVNLSDYNKEDVPNGEAFRIGIIHAEWNSNVTDALTEGAFNTLIENGVKKENIDMIAVPGTFELTTAADIMLTTKSDIDALICIGCVIQGETRHFDFICDAVSNGLTNVSLKHGKPVIFSVLTTNDMQQAIERAGGKHGNKGIEGAVTALKMCNLHKVLRSQ